jgi:hypothetical protein
MSETKNKTTTLKRPVIITIICILGFLGAVMMLLTLLNPSARTQMIQEEGVIIIPFLMSIFILWVAGMIGYWKMKRWGVYLYFVMAVISIGGGFLFNLQTGTFSYLMPIIVIGIGLIYFKRMT